VLPAFDSTWHAQTPAAAPTKWLVTGLLPFDCQFQQRCPSGWLGGALHDPAQPFKLIQQFILSRRRDAGQEAPTGRCALIHDTSP